MLLDRNGCKTDLLLCEWITLTHMIPIVKNNPDEHYLNIWQQVFKSKEIQPECRNIFHIIEILLCMLFSNTKLKRLFSRMAHVKNDYRNRLGRDLLNACLRINEGCNIASFNPDSAISASYKKKERPLAAKPHNYSSKRKQVSSASSSVSVVDIATITLSDLEDSDEELTRFDDDL